MSLYTSIILLVLLNIVYSRDFYVGMFERNDLMVAQDRLYKDRVPWRYQVAKYGRVFKCPITYFRVADRLGVGGGPRVQIIRGGLRKKLIVARITSPYNLPISVNIYAGCHNVRKSSFGTSTAGTDAGGAKTSPGTPAGGQNSTATGGGASDGGGDGGSTTDAGAGGATGGGGGDGASTPAPAA